MVDLQVIRSPNLQVVRTRSVNCLIEELCNTTSIISFGLRKHCALSRLEIDLQEIGKLWFGQNPKLLGPNLFGCLKLVVLLSLHCVIFDGLSEILPKISRRNSC
ncbi:hypothetical protein NE237_012466 [Protea cynaroides]|uniref:Uncharacterized protein n=1 Tax=Protea cynaroides TaxID=273540 RepID=A0A9Q0JZ94_9MAGN|nr:hypothetical protein NE237_012466 [Protea cynaroides]